VQSNSAFGPYPKYICKCGKIQSDICETATVAISSVYHQLFKTKTKFSGPEVLGFDKTIITDELLSDLPFRPYNFQLGILRIWIVRIGSNEITTNLAGPRFKSAFIYQYNKKYEIGDQEFRAWKAMLKNVGCSDITPYEKDQSKFEFWSRSITPDSDRSSLSTLYNLGFVTSAPLYSSMNAFWNSFHNSLKINKCGIDRRLVTNKPVIRHEKMSSEKNAQLQSFLMDKANIIMSSYKTNPITNEPVYYLKNSKDILWNKFHEEYPNGMCCFDVTVGQDIENAITGIKGTSVANLNPIRDRGSGNNTLPGNSNWFEWQWPTTGEFSGCIKARDIPSIGLIPSRLTRESLVKELEKRNFRFNNKENKDQLINLLENQLVEDTKQAKIAHNQTNSISNKENCHIFKVDKFSLNSGWALKANQKFGRKGTGKRISPEIRALLEGYFLAGNINKSDRYTAQDMHDELVQHAQEGEIKVEEVPKVATIQNWIGYYT
ncbi:6441_t:CDS:2, partial [Racocetra persica]